MGWTHRSAGALCLKTIFGMLSVIAAVYFPHLPSNRLLGYVLTGHKGGSARDVRTVITAAVDFVISVT